MGKGYIQYNLLKFHEITYEPVWADLVCYIYLSYKYSLMDIFELTIKLLVTI